MTVSQYVKGSCAVIFLLSNQSIQVIFADKVSFLMSKKALHVHTKNMEKYELYEDIPHTMEMAIRRKYVIIMANRLFHWSIDHY